MAPTRLYTGTTGVQPDPARTDRKERPSELRSRTACPPFDADPRGRYSHRGKSGDWVYQMGPVTVAVSFASDSGIERWKGPPREDIARLPFVSGSTIPWAAAGRECSGLGVSRS